MTRDLKNHPEHVGLRHLTVRELRFLIQSELVNTIETHRQNPPTHLTPDQIRHVKSLIDEYFSRGPSFLVKRERSGFLSRLAHLFKWGTAT